MMDFYIFKVIYFKDYFRCGPCLHKSRQQLPLEHSNCSDHLWLTIKNQVFEIMEFVGVITSNSMDLLDIGIAARPIGGGWALCGW